MLSKFQQVAKRGLELEENFILNMGRFNSSRANSPKPGECGTSFCFAGYLAALDEYPKEYITEVKYFMYTAYSEHLIGFPSNSIEWKFLFGDYWPNTFTSLKERCAYVLEHNTVPVSFVEVASHGEDGYRFFNTTDM